MGAEGRSFFTRDEFRITDRLKRVPTPVILGQAKAPEGMLSFSEEERQAEYMRRRLNFLLQQEVVKMAVKRRGDKA